MTALTHTGPADGLPWNCEWPFVVPASLSAFNLLTAPARGAHSFLGAVFHLPECHFHADAVKILMLRDEMASLQGRPHWIIDNVVDDMMEFRLTLHCLLFIHFYLELLLNFQGDKSMNIYIYIFIYITRISPSPCCMWKNACTAQSDLKRKKTSRKA